LAEITALCALAVVQKLSAHVLERAGSGHVGAQAMKADALTWTTVALLATFGLVDLAAAASGHETFSKLVGHWERHHLARKLIVAGLGVLLVAHLEFFP
jgi:hypothetical protein